MGFMHLCRLRGFIDQDLLVAKTWKSDKKYELLLHTICCSIMVHICIIVDHVIRYNMTYGITVIQFISKAMIDCEYPWALMMQYSLSWINVQYQQWHNLAVTFGNIVWEWKLLTLQVQVPYGSGHKGVAVLLPGFAIMW